LLFASFILLNPTPKNLLKALCGNWNAPAEPPACAWYTVMRSANAPARSTTTSAIGDIERVYTALGRRRAQQGVPLSSVCWALFLTEENLWEFLELEGLRENPLDILGGFELLRRLDKFFDQSIYFVTVGYESYLKEQEQTRAEHFAHAI